MTYPITPDDAELRQQINDIWVEIGAELSERFDSGQGSFDFEPYSEKITQLIQSDRRRLLERIAEILDNSDTDEIDKLEAIRRLMEEL